MTNMMRHVGKLKKTDTRCVVVMMQIPNREDHALIIESDSLPDHYHQTIMQILESKEGQANANFGDELARKQMFIANRGNMSVLTALHEAKFLRPVHIDDVIMTPQPGSAYSLRQILEGMHATIPGEKMALDPRNDPNAPKFNQHTHNRDVKSSEDKLSLASGLLKQASYIAAEATKLREQAYAMAPELRPRSAVSAETKVTDSAEANSTPAKASTKRGRGRPKGTTKKVSNT